MKDHLADNMSLCTQLEALPGPHNIYAGLAKPQLWEIQSPLTRVSCFLAYMAVLTSDAKKRNLLTYGRLVVREAQSHGGPGWQEYDKIFRQHSALDPSVQWNELNPSIHASTIMTYRSGTSQCCGLCHEPDDGAQTVLWWDCRLPRPLSHPHQGVSPSRAGQSAGQYAQRQQRGSASPGIAAAALSPPARSGISEPLASIEPKSARRLQWTRHKLTSGSSPRPFRAQGGGGMQA